LPEKAGCKLFDNLSYCWKPQEDELKDILMEPVDHLLLEFFKNLISDS